MFEPSDNDKTKKEIIQISSKFEMNEEKKLMKTLRVFFFFIEENMVAKIENKSNKNFKFPLDSLFPIKWYVKGGKDMNAN